MSTWMIYGAYGYTGTLIAEEAVRRGHRPVVSGRSREKLMPLAERLGLEAVAVDLADEAALHKAVADVDLVFHAAGPFVHTSDPMIRACLAGGTHYLDITGEIPAFQNTFNYGDAARQKGIAVISGAGFDVIPTDCLAKYVADQVPGAITLEIAVDAIVALSAGTAKSMLEMAATGGMWLRRNGELIAVPFARHARQIRFSNGERTAMLMPWGDLATAYHTTGIPNITTYLVLHSPALRIAILLMPIVSVLLANRAIRRIVSKLAERAFTGPSAQAQESERSYVWVCATDSRGKAVEAWLETMEGYRFTAVAGVHAVERVLQHHPQGVLTPAQALGTDFVLEIDDTKRFDSLPARQRA